MKIKKFLMAWGTWTVADITSKLSKGNFDMVMFDNNAVGANVKAIQAAFPNLKMLADLDMAGLENGGYPNGSYTSFDPASPNYIGLWVLNTWFAGLNGQLTKPYDGIYWDDCYPAGIGTVQNIKDLFDWLQVNRPGIIIAAQLGPFGYEDIQAHTTIWVMEGCFNGWLPTFGENWVGTPLQDIDIVANWAKQGLSCLPLCELSTAAGGRADQYDNDQMCAWDVACFLMAIQPSNTCYMAFSQAAAPSGGYFPIMDIDIGDPTSPYTQTGNILTRHFTKGMIQVDLANHIGTITQSGTLTIIDGVGGTMTPAPGTYDTTLGSIIEVLATAAQGYTLTGWIFNDAPYQTGTPSNPLRVSIFQAAESIQPVFTATGAPPPPVTAGVNPAVVAGIVVVILAVAAYGLSRGGKRG